MLVAEIRQDLDDLVTQFRALDQRLTQLTSTLEGQVFAEGTDAPLNLEAAICSLVTNTQQDELKSVIQALDTAARISSQPPSQGLRTESL